jgi:hypothetical protein
MPENLRTATSSATVDEGTFTTRQRLLAFLAALVVTFVV